MKPLHPASATLKIFNHVTGTGLRGGGNQFLKLGTSVSYDPYLELRERMVETQLRKRGVKDEAVLRAAVGRVSRGLTASVRV